MHIFHTHTYLCTYPDPLFGAMINGRAWFHARSTIVLDPLSGAMVNGRTWFASTL